MGPNGKEPGKGDRDGPRGGEGGGPGSPACRSCSAPGTSASGRTSRSSTWRRSFRGPRRKPSPARRATPGSSSSRPSSSGAPRGVYHNSLAVIDADGTVAGIYRKYAHPGRPVVLRESSISPRATWGSAPSTRGRGASAPHRAGTSGTRRGPGSRRSPEPRSCSTLRHRWHPMKRRSTAGGSSTRGAPCSADTRSPTACTWRRSTGWGARGAGRRRGGDRVLGLLVPLRSAGAGPDEGSPRTGRRSSSRGRSRPSRGRPEELAVPARPPDRRLRRDHRRYLDDGEGKEG
jgi:hypothetical protein